MTASTTYYLDTVTEAVCEDGIPRRLEIYTVTAPAGVTILEGVARDGGIVRSREVPDHPLSPVVSTRLGVRWQNANAGAAARAFLALPYGDVVGLLKEDWNDDGTYETTVYAGYLVPDRATSRPGDPLAGVDIAFNDGRGLLNDLPAVDPSAPGYNPEATAELIDRLATWLDPLATANAFVENGVTALLSWSAGGSSDVSCKDGAFVDSDGVVELQAAAVRYVAGRTGGRLFQAPPDTIGGKPAWRLVDRAALAAGLGGAGYADYDVLAENGGDRDLSVVGVTESYDPTLVYAESARRFAAPLDDLIVNGSFEEGTGTGDGTASDTSAVDDWETGTAPLKYGQRYDLAGYDPDAANRFALAVYSFQGEPPGSVVQRDMVTAVGSAGGAYELSVVSNAVLSGDTETGTWGLRVDVGTHGLRSARVRVRGTLKGEGVGVECSPVAKGTGTNTSDSDAAERAVVARPGTPLAVVGTGLSPAPTLTLTEPARVGDTVLVGDLSETFEGDHYVVLFYFGPPGSTPNVLGVPKSARDTFDAYTVRAPALDCTGETVVSGVVRVDLVGPPAPPDSPSPVTYFRHLYDRVRLGLLDEAGRAPRGSITGGTLPVRGEGTLSLPVSDRDGWPLGDGPRPDSPGALSVPAGPTGAAGGRTWASSALDTAAGAPYTFDSVDALAVASALSQFGGAPAPAIWEGRLLMREGRAYEPWRPLVLSHPDGLGGWRSARCWWDSLVEDLTAGTVDVRATELRLADVSGRTETYSLTS